MIPDREEMVRRAARRRSRQEASVPSSSSPSREARVNLPADVIVNRRLQELELALAERDHTLRKRERKLRRLERRLMEARQRADDAERVSRGHQEAYKELMSQVSDARDYADVQIVDAVSDYKASAAFSLEIMEAADTGFEFGFDECKQKIVELFPGIDLSAVMPTARSPGTPPAS